MSDKSGDCMFIPRPATADNISIIDQRTEVRNQEKSRRRIRKSLSMDSGEVRNKSLKSTSNTSKKFIRRSHSKRSLRPAQDFGNDTDAYEKIRQDVLQERAVTNAIDALQERLGLIEMMYKDCVESYRKRQNQKLKKLCIQRQLEIIVMLVTFLTVCLPVIAIFIQLMYCPSSAQ